MPPEARWLPLFPLNTVLFPSDALPLQIFEERYKQMMQDCLDSGGKCKTPDEQGGPMNERA